MNHPATGGATAMEDGSPIFDSGEWLDDTDARLEHYAEIADWPLKSEVTVIPSIPETIPVLSRAQALINLYDPYFS